MDNISRSGLVNMCRYMGLPPFGNDNFLRFQLRSKLRAITQVHMLLCDRVERSQLSRSKRERALTRFDTSC